MEQPNWRKGRKGGGGEGKGVPQSNRDNGVKGYNSNWCSEATVENCGLGRFDSAFMSVSFI